MSKSYPDPESESTPGSIPDEIGTPGPWKAGLNFVTRAALWEVLACVAKGATELARRSS